MKKRILIIGGIVVLVVVLAGAAFVGGQLFQAQQQAQAKNNLQGAPRKLVTPAPEVPITAPDVLGDTIRRDGNSIFVCESNPTLSINPDGTINKNDSCTLEVEVVIGHDTVLLHDVSALRNPEPVKQGQDYVIRQIVELGSINDISAGTAIRAWGQLTGTRVVARTLLYWNRSPQPAVVPGS
jgi:hypothetical protein